MYIYKITNLINGKIYIGQTINSVSTRFKDHCKLSRDKTPIDRAINKYGKENFIVEIICKAYSIEQLNELEQYYIYLYNAQNTNIGYNLCDGGHNSCGYHHSDDSKLKMSISRKGTQRGVNNNFYGKHHSVEAKQKIRDAKLGVKQSQEWIDKCNNAKFKKIVCIDDNKVYGSIKEAASVYGILATHISRVCRGKRKSCGGLRFQYVD